MKILEVYRKKLRFKRYAERTVEVYEYYLSEFLKELKIKDPYQVSTKQIISYLENRNYSSVSQQNQIIGCLKLFARYILNKSDVHLNKIERPRQERKLQPVIPRDHILKSLDNIENLKHKSILTLGYACGLRVSEVINLQWKHLDRSQEIIYIQCSKGKKDRIVPINEKIISLLEDYWHEFKTQTYVFSGQDWRPQYTSASCNNLVKKYIGKKYRFHSLRKSCATHLYELDNDLSKIQDLLGHQKPETKN
jgi:site-specific recombinase XerD